MKKTVIYFVISSFIGLGIGYVMFDLFGNNDNTPTAQTSPNESVENKNETENNHTETDTDEQENTENENASETVSVDTKIFTDKGCLGCHAVSELNLSGGATGPDLSKAFEVVEGKHGKPIDEFLKQPTSAVMSSVISSNPLTDDEIAKITELLKKAASEE